METVRRRKNKPKQKRVQDVSADSETSDENTKKEECNHSNDLLNEGKQVVENHQRHNVDTASPVEENKRLFRVSFEVDLVSIVLLLCGLVTRMYRLEEPKNIV